MVVDNSAIAAILFMEREADDFLWKMERADSLKLSAVTLLELSMIAMRLGSRELEEDLEAFLRRGGFQVVPFDLSQTLLAIAAFRRFGKGRPIPPGLNFGDCMTYALAKQTGEPLLFKGDDFSRTDLLLA